MGGSVLPTIRAYFVDEIGLLRSIHMTYLGFDGGWGRLAWCPARKTRVPDVLERGESFMLNVSCRTGLDLTRLTALKVL